MEPEPRKSVASEDGSETPAANEAAGERADSSSLALKGREVVRSVDPAKFSQISRRELLKVAPVLGLGIFAVPRVQQSLLKKGLGFSDWASARLFRRGHHALTFADADLTPVDQFPINDYDVDDPGVNLENWTLTVSGALQKPGEYRLEQVQALPKFRQNTRHVCVEGWDVIGRFGGNPTSSRPMRSWPTSAPRARHTCSRSPSGKRSRSGSRTNSSRAATRKSSTRWRPTTARVFRTS